MDTRNRLSPAYFFSFLGALCLLYLGFEWFFNAYSLITVDEFWFAHRIYQYKDGLPYKNFAPYKTVLGYYFLLLPMLAHKSILQTLIFTKNFIAILNTLFLFISASWLTRFFAPRAILLSLAALCLSETLLFYSTQIRVDLLGYWLGFFSLLLLLEKRFLIAGLFIGLGFVTSQKTIWYLFASNVSLLSCAWMMRERKSILQFIKFNTGCFAVIASYLVLWSLLSDWQTVYQSVFGEASALYHLNWYDASRKMYWSINMTANPLMFLLWPLTLLSLFITFPKDRTYQTRFFVTIYAWVVLLCLIPYKQVFPYYMQVTTPLLFILYAAFFTWLFALLRSPQSALLLNKNLYRLSTLLYMLGVAILIYSFQLPIAYALICLIPLALLIYSSSPTKLCQQLVIISLIFVGGIYPVLVVAQKIKATNGDYQKAHIVAIEQLLADGGDYVAGIELIYNKNQPIPGLRHLMGPAIDYLDHPNDHLRTVMLASLYEDPHANMDTVITALQNSSVKFYVNNYRMAALPPKIKNYLATQYQHLWGSIYIYAPTIDANQKHFQLKFAGKYRLEATDVACIDKLCLKPAAEVTLSQGEHQVLAKQNFRLQFIPQLHTNPAFAADEWIKLLY